MKKAVLFSLEEKSRSRIKGILKEYSFDVINKNIDYGVVSFYIKSALQTYKPNLVIFCDLNFDENQIKNIIEIFKDINTPVIEYESKILPVFIGEGQNYYERNPKDDNDFSMFIDEILELPFVLQQFSQKNNFKIINIFKIFMK